MVAVPLLALVAVALVALAIIYGAKLLTRLLQALFDRIPVPGMSTVGRFIVSVADTAVAGIEAILSAAATPAVALITAGPRAIGALLDDIATAADTLYWQIVYTGRRVAALITATGHYIMGVVWALDSELRALVAATGSYIMARVWALDRELRALVAAEAAAVLARVWALDSELRALVAATGSYIMGVLAGELARVDAALTYLANRVSAVESVALNYARSVALDAEHAAISTVDSTAAAAVGTVWPDITADADALAGELATDLPDLRALVDAIPRVRPLDLAGALAGVGAVEAVLTKYLRDCGVPNCRNLGKFGRDLQALFGLVEDGALFALLAALITDPQDTVRPLHDFLAPIAGDAVTAGRALAGV